MLQFAKEIAHGQNTIMKKITFALMSVRSSVCLGMCSVAFAIGCGSGTTTGTRDETEDPNGTVIEVVDGDSGTKADSGTAPAPGDDDDDTVATRDAAVDAGMSAVQDSGSIVDAAPDQDSGTLARILDPQLIGTWVGTGGFFRFEPGTEGYSYTHVYGQEYWDAGSSLDQEDDGVAILTTTGVLTITIDASSCQPYENQPAPEQLAYWFSQDGTTLYMGPSLTSAWNFRGTKTTAMPEYETACSPEYNGQYTGWIPGPVTSF